jgi:cell division protease FtsH
VNLQRLFRGPFLWIFVLLVALYATVSMVNRAAGPQEITFSQWERAAVENRVDTVKIRSRSHVLEGEMRHEGQTIQYETSYDPELLGDNIREVIREHGIREIEVNPEQTSPIVSFFFSLLPFLLIFLLFFWLITQMQGGGGRVMQFGKAKAKMVSKDQPKVTFADVAGADEAVEELREIKEFLENPQKFQTIGAKIPKGVLLYGPPGTGKTLLARAVAGEAGVPVLSISGYQFVEFLVGVGA